MIRPVLMLGHPVLRQRCDRVADIEAVTSTAVDLHDTLTDLRQRHGFGRGLAAPQIGTPIRMVVLLWPSELVLINPEIIQSLGSQTVWDDCFSIPGMMMKIERARTVVLKYQDQSGTWQQMTCRDSAAELVQHELDHLDGVLAIDLVGNPSGLMMRPEWESQRRQGLILGESEA